MKNKEYAAVGIKNDYDPSFISKSTQALHKISKSVVTGQRNAGKSDTRQATIPEQRLTNPQPPVKSTCQIYCREFGFHLSSNANKIISTCISPWTPDIYVIE